MYTLNMRNELRTRGSDPSTGGQITFATKHTHTFAGPTPDAFSRNARSSLGAVEAGNGTRDEKRVLGGNLSRRLDVHVETHIATDVDVGSTNTIEVSFTN
jgi:hypothetical protein